MTTMVQELRGVLARRIEAAPQAEVLSIVSALCAGEAPVRAPVSTGASARPARRFVKLDEDGIAIPDDSSDWWAVEDTATGLIWDRRAAAKTVAWKDRDSALPKSLCGWSDWRVPSVRELLSLVDYGRHEPAIDTRYFECGASEWFWTSTPFHESPSGFAWCVSFNNGYSNWDRQNHEGRVRAVRAGQSLGLLAG